MASSNAGSIRLNYMILASAVLAIVAHAANPIIRRDWFGQSSTIAANGFMQEAPTHPFVIVCAEFSGGDMDAITILPTLPPGMRAVMYTDQPMRSTHSSGWRIVNKTYHTDETGPWATNSKAGRYSSGNVRNPKIKGIMAAKFYKMNAFLLPELQGYDVISWFDGHFFSGHGSLNPDLPQLAGSLLRNKDMLVPLHPNRNTVKDEVAPAGSRAAAEVGMPGVESDTEEAYQHELKEGFKDDQGLFWCGMFAYHAKDHKVRAALQSWWAEVQTYTFRDQISFPYIVGRHGLVLSSPSAQWVQEHLFQHSQLSFMFSD